MVHKHCFEVVDKLCRDILRMFNTRSKNLPFRGKIVVLGSDFIKIILVIPKGTRHDIVHNNINSTYIRQFY